MFQTIGHKGGFVQLSTFGNTTNITAWCHGERLGDYKTVSGAKSAITRSHKQWLADRNSEHHAAILEIVS